MSEGNGEVGEVRWEPIVQELAEKIEKESWTAMFNEAIKNAQSYGIPEMKDITSLSKYLDYINHLLFWVPQESFQGKDIYYRLCMFYFLLDQPTIKQLQTPIKPEYARSELSWLSDWLVRYAQDMGKFLDRPESLTEDSLRTFKDSPSYHMDEYLEPHGGWRTFNELFGRNFKPGYRPIADVANSKVIVSPADSTFDGQWHIQSDSTISIKHLTWTIKELLQGSEYSERFNGGTFMHAFLGPSDYHRQHAPVDGTVVEARVIKGQVYLEVTVKDGNGDKGKPRLDLHRNFDAPDHAGYQFCQMRGLVVLDTPIGLVAVLPIGMAQVSSVIVTAEVGKTLRKGEELSYFQFGGSDIVLVFEAKSKVKITAKRTHHYRVGEQIGSAELAD